MANIGIEATERSATVTGEDNGVFGVVVGVASELGMKPEGVRVVLNYRGLEKVVREGGPELKSLEDGLGCKVGDIGNAKGLVEGWNDVQVGNFVR
jgi:hypothetical protein